MEDETKPPTRMSKNELKQALLDLGHKEESLQDAQGKCLKRPELLEKLQAFKNEDEGEKVVVPPDTEELTALSNAVEEEDDIGIEVKSSTSTGAEEDLGETLTKPSDMGGSSIDISVDDDEICEEVLTPSDPGWTQYVLGKFLDDEMDGQNPRVEGLRRVAGELVGELIEEGCDLVASPTEENRLRACAKAWGVFHTSDGITKRFEALADAHSGNCLEDYATYLVAMADTRAKGRMFRNALHLRRVVAAEEVSKTMATTADVQSGGSIHVGSITMLRMIADRQGFNIEEVLKDLGIEYTLNDSTGEVNLTLLSYEDALIVSKKMREMKEGKEKESE